MSPRGGKRGYTFQPGQSPDETPITSSVTPAAPEVADAADSHHGRPSDGVNALRRATKVGAAGIIAAAIITGPGRKAETPKAPPVRITRSGSPGQSSGGESGAGGNGGAGEGGSPSDAPNAGNGGSNGGYAGLPDGGADAGHGGSTETEIYDPCGPNFVYGETTETGQPYECVFSDGPNGKVGITGHILLNESGTPSTCFLTPAWSSGTAIKLAGDVEGNIYTPGQISMLKGKMCVTMLENGMDAETQIPAEAPVSVLTTGRAMMKIEEDSTTTSGRGVKRFLIVHPVLGETLIIQEGRTEQIRLSEGDTPVRIPLNIDRIPVGCYIAQKDIPAEHDGTSALLIGAGAVFLVLRRRQKKDKGKRR